MTRKEYYTYIKPYLTSDKGFNRQLFNDVKDVLHKDGKITDRQVFNWNYPNNRFFNHKELKQC